MLFTAAGVVIGLAAFASANNLLFLVLAAMLATLLVSSFISRLSLAGLEVEFMHPDHIAARRKVMGRVVVHNDKLMVPSFSIWLTGSEGSGFGAPLYFPGIPAHGKVEENIELYFPNRGAYNENTFYFSTRFPFGFADRRIPVAVRQDIIVYPALEPAADLEDILEGMAGEIQSHFRGRSSDFYRIRPYVRSDSARHVDWKATAHTGELQVREFANEEEHAVTVFLDLDLPAGDIFENAVECCAYLVWRLTRRSLARVRLVSQNCSIEAASEGAVYTMLKYLALVASTPGLALPAPDEPDSVHILFTARERALSALGWGAHAPGDAYVVGPARLNAARSGTDSRSPAGNKDRAG